MNDVDKGVLARSTSLNLLHSVCIFSLFFIRCNLFLIFHIPSLLYVRLQ